MAGILALSREKATLCSQQYAMPRHKIMVLPNAVDTSRFKPRDKTQIRHKLGLPRDRLIVVFAGHFRERKGPLRVQAALERLAEVGAVFLGDGPQRPSGPQVLFAGNVAHTEVACWMSAADAFAFPTLAEGSPNVVLEAMACGLPIISSRIPSLVETVPESASRLADPMDIDALAAAMREVLNDDSLRASMSRAAIDKVTVFALP